MDEVEAPAIDDDAAWQEYQPLWTIRNDTIYLNHGSFGPPPVAVQERGTSGNGN